MVFPQGNIAAKDLQARPMELYMCSVLKRQGYGEGKFCSNGCRDSLACRDTVKTLSLIRA